MDEPLGLAVGNALEVEESIGCLKGSGARDLMEVTFAIGEQMLILPGVAKDRAEARGMLERSISSGAAHKKFRDMVTAQGGDARVADDPALLPQARLIMEMPSARAGFVVDVDALGVALAGLHLGAGRAKADERVDHAVGIDRLVKTGDAVRLGEPLCRIHANDEGKLEEASRLLEKAIVVGDAKRAPAVLIDEIIG